MSIKVEELVHLNAPLCLVELHYEQESSKIIPWSKDIFNISPYIFYKKVNDQVYFYYDPQGVKWQIEMAGKYENEKYAIENILNLFGLVEGILKNEETLDRNSFINFIYNIRKLWPWMNYMWWAIEYKEKNGKDFSDLLKIRKYTEFFTPGIMSVIRKSIKNIYPNLDKYSDVILLSEIEKNSIPDVEVLEKRLKEYAYTNNRLYFSWEDLLVDYDIEIINHVQEKTSVLKGQTAFPGKVVGKIHIVSKKDDISSFEEGDILLSSTTTPDFLPAMKKASAIISEHGGVICHAAITSRELKIPCVVGVKGAINTLKNGDMVEVDADNGIVKII